MQISAEEYERVLHTYYITDCAVRNRNMFNFVADRWYSDEEVEKEEREGMDPAFRDKRVIPFMRLKEAGKRLSYTHFSGWGNISGGAALHPKDQFVGVELEEDRVFVVGSGEAYGDEKVPAWQVNGPNRGGITRVKTIGGFAYVCGGARSVGKRTGKGQWISHTQSIPCSPDPTDNTEGFSDIDGFNENDIYAVGGKGDVWHYDGTSWKQMPFPTNTYVQSVCCGGDGFVYVGCYEGLTFVGRRDRWKKIYDGGINLGFRDMVWHEGRVWCTSDYGLWQIENNMLSTAKGLSPEVYVCSGNLYVGDGVMLMAGLGGAAFNEKGVWHSIFVRSEMERLVSGKK